MSRTLQTDLGFAGEDGFLGGRVAGSAGAAETLLPCRRNVAVSVGEVDKGRLQKVLGGERRVGLRPGREFKV